MSGSYILGFCVGLGSVILIGAIIFLIAKNNRNQIREYDERQKAVRGVAYKYAYITLAAYVICNAVFTSVTDIKWADAFTEAFIGLCVSFLVFIILCIFKDAYLSLSERPKNVILTLGIVGAANAVMGLTAILQKSMITDGVLTFHSANLVCAVMTGIVLCIYIPKILSDKKARRNG